MGMMKRSARRVAAWVACAELCAGVAAWAAQPASPQGAGRSAQAAVGARSRQPAGGGTATKAGSSARGKSAPLSGTGILHLDYDDFDLTLLGPRGQRDVSSRDGTVTLPAATYTLLAWTIRTTGADGRHWQARGGMGVDDLVIRPGQVTRLALASPLKARWVSVRPGNPQLLELKFTGTSGEECCGVGVDGNGPPPPHFEIRDTGGQRVAEGNIRFCCKFRGGAIWAPAPGTQGKFTAHVTADWGPFRVQMERPIEVTVSGSAAPQAPLAVGTVAPDVSLRPTEGGAEVTLSSLRARPVVLCFFCGCGPCATVAEGVAHLADTDAVAVVTDVETFRGDHLRKFREATGFHGPVLFDREGEAARAYKSITCPRVWLIDREGKIAFAHSDAHVDPAQILADLRAARAGLDTYGSETKAAKLD
jgi:peroxiredoxin